MRDCVTHHNLFRLSSRDEASTYIISFNKFGLLTSLTTKTNISIHKSGINYSPTKTMTPKDAFDAMEAGKWSDVKEIVVVLAKE